MHKEFDFLLIWGLCSINFVFFLEISQIIQTLIVWKLDYATLVFWGSYSSCPSVVITITLFRGVNSKRFLVEIATERTFEAFFIIIYL